MQRVVSMLTPFSILIIRPHDSSTLFTKNTVIETIRGSLPISLNRVVFHGKYGGLSNVIMGFVSSYLVAMALDLPLYCASVITVLNYR